MKKANRTRGRGMQLSKERIEKDLVKLKARMNRLYVEVMARERALELFTVRDDSRTFEEATKEAEITFANTEEAASGITVAPKEEK